MAVPCEGEQPVVVGLPAHVHWSHGLQCVHHCQLPAGGRARGLDHHSRGKCCCPLLALCRPVSASELFCGTAAEGCQYVPASVHAPVLVVANAPGPALAVPPSR